MSSPSAIASLTTTATSPNSSSATSTAASIDPPSTIASTASGPASAASSTVAFTSAIPASFAASRRPVGSGRTSPTSIPRSATNATSFIKIKSAGDDSPSPSRSGIAAAAPSVPSSIIGGGGNISLSSVFSYATPGLTTAASSDCSTSSPIGTNGPSVGTQPSGGPPSSPGANPVPPVISSESVGVISGGASEPIFTIVAVPSRSSILKSVSIASLASSSSISKSSASRSATFECGNSSIKSSMKSSSSSESSSPSSSLHSISTAILSSSESSSRPSAFLSSFFLFITSLAFSSIESSSCLTFTLLPKLPSVP